jgi:hypothetical protein
MKYKKTDSLRKVVLDYKIPPLSISIESTSSSNNNISLGDIVICVRSEFGNETVGKLYIAIQQRGSLIFIAQDDNGYRNSYDISQMRMASSREILRLSEDQRLKLRALQREVRNETYVYRY